MAYGARGLKNLIYSNEYNSQYSAIRKNNNFKAIFGKWGQRFQNWEPYAFTDFENYVVFDML